MNAILPLKLNGGKNTGNRARCGILFSSLAAFAEPGFFERILVVVPPEDRETAQKLCDEWASLPLAVVEEHEYLPALRHRRVPGSFRQMAIKLHAANHFDTPFFLTLDADVILCKRLRRSDLFSGTRALLEPCPRDIHPLWWICSARILGLRASLTGPGMSVTPAILARSICLRLFDDLELRYRRNWAETLLRLRSLVWTEYALYYLSAEAHGTIRDYHVTAGVEGEGRIFCPAAVWSRSQFDSWNVEECFDPAVPGFFTVVQSNTRISPDAVRRRLAPYFPLSQA
jgi:hypothetical protein